MFPNTLAARLFALSSLTAVIGLIVVALVISADYRRTAENRQNDLLIANIFNLMGSFEVNENGDLVGVPELGDPRYALFDSGWYWSVEKIGDAQNRVVSQSLANRSITVPAGIEFDQTFQRQFEVVDDSGKSLFGLEAQVFLGEGDDLYSFLITANKGVMDDEIRQFVNRLGFILSVFALSIILATYLAVRFGLRPLSRATEILGVIRRGDATRIDGEFPNEIKPLIDETNALIDSNITIVERAKTQVGNLAHSLKTPLAVMQNEAPKLDGELRGLFEEQIQTMRKQVQVYLDRARISARTSTAISSTELVPTIERLVDVIAKLNPKVDFGFDYDDDQEIIFEGEEHDLQEIFGNLIENAAKYANYMVEVTAGFSSGSVVITVSDDGPGMTEEEIEKARRRGGRADEGKTGWGLGMSIVRDIVDEYEGAFDLGKSDLGGLEARITLPGRINQ